MPIEVSQLVAGLVPEATSLLFGAGSSIPSNAPSVGQLQRHFEAVFGVSARDYNLAEQTGIIEQRTRDRRRLIEELRSQFKGVSPTGALLNLPLYTWKSIYTTNYDDMVESSFKRRGRSLKVFSSNFDFGQRQMPGDVQLFKLHGTIESDVSDGNQSRIILTEGDYDYTSDFRQQLFDRLGADLASGTLVIIGHSLADPDIRSVVDRALTINRSAGGTGKIVLFMYTKDEGRAGLFEARGIDVCFGGIDDFFAGLASRVGASSSSAVLTSEDPLDHHPALRPATIDAAHALATGKPDVSGMYNGWPASYADIAAGLTFRRDLADPITDQLVAGEKHVAVLLGPSGVGKTTAARQIVRRLSELGFWAWEHKPEQPLLAYKWREVAANLRNNDRVGCLLIDDAHLELAEINDLLDYLNSDISKNLRLILVSTSNQWLPRIKTPSLHKSSTEHQINKVHQSEIDRLLNLIENSHELSSLVEDSFSGFSRAERRRRLVQRCEADMFVCLKNIFASEKFDDIILREYATLEHTLQDVYKIVAAMEAAGVRVRRQLVIRLLGIPSDQVSAILARLTDIIHEQSVDERLGIYSWRGRHRVIMNIVADHKYYPEKQKFDLLSNVIDSVQPSYDIEIRTLRELCGDEGGISSISDKKQQNILLRKMLSVAPRERVPRHRLIRNLISLGDYERAETEVRLFEKDFKLDGPAARYKIDLGVARAIYSPGLLDEDRFVLLDKVRESAANLASRFSQNKQVLTSYCEVGLHIARYTGDGSVFLAAINELKSAEQKTGDADISRRIARLEHRMDMIVTASADEPALEFEDE